jgi:hypothetical protein
LGLLLGFLGPFGSNPAYPTATRYAFWLGLTAAGVVAAVAANAMLPRTRLRDGAIRIGAVALVSALPMTFVVAWTMSLVQPGRVFTPQQLPALFAASRPFNCWSFTRRQSPRPRPMALRHPAVRRLFPNRGQRRFPLPFPPPC